MAIGDAYPENDIMLRGRGKAMRARGGKGAHFGRGLGTTDWIKSCPL